MDKRGYQHGFAAGMGGAMYDHSQRERKARTMAAVFTDHLGPVLQGLDLLDVGASTGTIPHYLSSLFRQAIGIDIDADAIGYAARRYRRKNLHYAVADAMSVCFPPERFDVVVCAQVYEHVPDAARLMEEIERVLKPGGVCYFAAGNRFQIMEPHYRLPFLSWLPRSLAHRYIRLAGKAPFYYEQHLSYPELKHLVRRFRRIDYNVRLIENPEKFALSYMLPENRFKTRMARLVVRHFYGLCPGFVWLLEK